MEDKLIRPEELAERLNTSVDWIYRHWKALPFAIKLSSRQLRFSNKGLEKYLEEQLHARQRVQARYDLLD